MSEQRNLITGEEEIKDVPLVLDKSDPCSTAYETEVLGLYHDKAHSYKVYKYSILDQDTFYLYHIRFL